MQSSTDCPQNLVLHYEKKNQKYTWIILFFCMLYPNKLLHRRCMDGHQVLLLYSNLLSCECILNEVGRCASVLVLYDFRTVE